MPNSTNRELAKLEAAMVERPPRIEWRLDPVRRIQVAWCVDDPHMEQDPYPVRRQRQIEAYAPKRVEIPVCTDEGLLAAARAAI